MIEVWLIGTPVELDTAARALAGCGHVADHSDRIPLFGADTGRYRTYARIHIPTGCAPPPAVLEPPVPASPQETLT